MSLFSIMTINPKTDNVTKESLTEEVKKVFETLLPVSYIDYPTFKRGTETSPVSLYIMNKQDKEEMAAAAQDINALKRTFNSGFKVGSYTTGMSKAFDPRYMVLDVHDISELGYKEVYAIRLLMSEKIPVSHYSILRDACNLLSQKYITTLFSVGKESNIKIEAVERYDFGRVTAGAVTRAGSGILGIHTKQWGISINDILKTLDNNIEVMMAPRDLQDLETILHDHLESKKYIQTLPDSAESREMKQVDRDINQVMSELHRIKKFLKEEPKVISSYLRVYDPVKLQKYKVTDVKLHQNNKEVWS